MGYVVRQAADPQRVDESPAHVHMLALSTATHTASTAVRSMACMLTLGQACGLCVGEARGAGADGRRTSASSSWPVNTTVKWRGASPMAVGVSPALLLRMGLRSPLR